MKPTKLPAKRLAFNPRTNDLKEFEQLAAAAKDAGFTHIHIGDLHAKTDYRGEDKDSPWCDWSAVLPSIFKCVTPPGLEDAFPAEFVKKQMAFMKAKHKILAKLGMKAAFWGCEPHWLSERVWKKHPEWRGSRCDNSLRTVGMFFAPNVYHPEVLAAYREGVRMMVKELPLLEIFSFATNDSGAGFPWTKRLYVNPNGPTGYLGRDIGDCVVNFALAMRDGAKDAGADATIFFPASGWFNDDEVHLIRKSLKPGVGIYGIAPEPFTADGSLIGCGGWGGSVWRPAPLVDKYPTPTLVVNGARNILTSKVRTLEAGGNSFDYFTALKVALKMPPATNERTKMDVLRKMAEEVFASDVVDEIVDAWYTLERAETMMSVAGVGTFGGPLMLRWLTRPFVAHQEMLTEEEKSYWVPYLYQSQASQPDTWLDYLNQSGYKIAHTWEDAGRVCCAIDAVEVTLATAAAKLQEAAAKTKVKKAKDKLIADSFRARAMRCLTLTVRHYLQLGTLIYARDAFLKKLAERGEPMKSTDPEDYPSLPKGNYGDNGLFFLHRAMRWELDNTNELIKLVKESPVPLFYTAPTKEWACSLLLEPNYAENLQKKVDITLKYWRTAEIGWYRPTLGG